MDYGVIIPELTDFKPAGPHILVNDIPKTQDNAAALRENLLTEVHDADIVPTMTCSCGAADDAIIGGKCIECGKAIEIEAHNVISPKVYITSPPGVHKLIKGQVLIGLKKAFDRKDFSPLLYLLDKSYNEKGPTKDAIDRLGIARGYNFFVENMEAIVNSLAALPAFVGKKAVEDIASEVSIVGQNAFTEFIYLPSRRLFSVEHSYRKRYVHKPLALVVDTALIMMSTSTEDNVKDVEDATGRALYVYAKFTEEYFKDIVTGKKKFIKKNVFSTRVVRGFRCVGVSTNGPYNEMEIPWGPVLIAFKSEIVSKLMKRGYTLSDALANIDGHVYKYSKELDDILTELENEIPEKYFSVITQRFPSLLLGNKSPMKAKRKKNPLDMAVGHPQISVSTSNTDYDGDEHTVSIPPDLNTARGYFKSMDKSVLLLDATKVRKLSRHLDQPKPTLSNLARFLDSEQKVDKVIEKNMYIEFGVRK